MNAKEEILKMLNGRLFLASKLKLEGYEDTVLFLKQLITATEAAIFDVPSEEEIKQYLGFDSRESEIFLNGCKFILNYKKPESDEKNN